MFLKKNGWVLALTKRVSSNRFVSLQLQREKEGLIIIILRVKSMRVSLLQVVHNLLENMLCGVGITEQWREGHRIARELIIGSDNLVIIGISQ